MTKLEIRAATLRSQLESREMYGYHVFLWRQWKRDGYGFGRFRLVFHGERW